MRAATSRAGRLSPTDPATAPAPGRREPPGRGGIDRGGRALPLAGAVALGALLALAAAEGAIRLAAAISPRAHFLARGSVGRPVQEAGSLEVFARAWPVGPGPHRPWLGYWTNVLGFSDEEWLEPKPTGRRRVVALGDSNTFGIVPYPDSVMTLLRARLRRGCAERDLDLLNLGSRPTWCSLASTAATMARTSTASSTTARRPSGCSDDRISGRSGRTC
jgi:hypothetical protein